MINHKAIDWFTLKDRGKVATLNNWQECDDFNHLLGKEVMIDDKVYIVKGVERRAHMPPFRVGEPIGILVDE